MKLTLLVAGAGVAGLVLAAGCSGDTSAGTDGSSEDEYTTFASHEEIVAAAEAEGGTYRALTSLGEEVNANIAEGFMKKYPFIDDATVTELQNDQEERTLLELQAGQVDFDTLHGGGGTAGFDHRYLEFSAKYDLLAMSEAGALDIPVGMINPDQPETLFLGSSVGAIAWNKNLVSEDEVPKTYEDFLDPKWKGKFMTNIEGTNITLLRQAWGIERTEKYITDLLANDPIWTDSDTAGLTAMAAGEFPLALGNNFHSAYRIQLESPEVIGIAVLDPAPVRLAQPQFIRAGTDHPARALLFLEYLASPEVQAWLDELEPAQASIYRDGTITEGLVDDMEQLAVMDWDVVEVFQDWLARTQELWGFPVGKIDG